MIPILTKEKQKGYFYDNEHFDSKDEIWFKWYLDELVDAGFIKAVVYQPNGYILSASKQYPIHVQLKTKIKIVKRTLLKGHIYTPDFKIIWSKTAKGIFYQEIYGREKLEAPFIAYDGISVIEVKPNFDMNNMTRLFTINQKWTMEKHGVYVQAIQLTPKTKGGKITAHKNAIFNTSFCPERFRWTDKSLKARKAGVMFGGLEQFIDQKAKIKVPPESN